MISFEITQEISAGLVLGALCLLAAYVAILRPQLLRRFRAKCGRGGGAPVSRLGAASWATSLGVFALTSFLAGTGTIPETYVPFGLIAGFLIVLSGGIYDSIKRGVNGPNQSSDPVLASGTPRAGHEPRHREHGSSQRYTALPMTLRPEAPHEGGASGDSACWRIDSDQVAAPILGSQPGASAW